MTYYLVLNLRRQLDVACVYLANAGLTVRSLMAALLVIRLRLSAEAGAIGDKTNSPRARAKSRWTLNRMAEHYDTAVPGMAAELRFLASRDGIEE
jgi:hypothetical protein